MFDEIIGFIQSIRGYLQGQIGTKSDADSGTGTVMARLKNIISTLIPGVNANVKKYGMFTTIAHAGYDNAAPTGSTYYTVATITGAGNLYRAGAYCGANNQSLNMKITLDGTAYTLAGFTNRNFAAPIGSIIDATSVAINMGSNTVQVIGPIKFNTSLKVEVMNVGTTALHGYAQWGLEK